MDALVRLSKSGSPGPAPCFTLPHIVLAFLTIADSQYVGRLSLSKKSGVGEGPARTILKKLKGAGFVDIIRSGCFLTPSGRRLAESLESHMSAFVPMPPSSLTVGDHQVAVALRSVGKRVNSGIEQRDSAIRIGASGATTYVVKGGRFTIPYGSSDCERDFPSEAWSILKDSLRPKNDDVIVLCGAGDDVSARLGVLSAATTLL